MNKKKGMPPIVRLVILIVITAATWIIFESYRGFTVEPDTEIPEAVLRPLSPQLDSGALDELQRRIHLGEGEIGDSVLILPDQGVVRSASDGGTLDE